MTQNKENFSLEIERIKLERLKVYGKMITVFISIGLGTFAVALINYSYQKNQLELQDKKTKAELRLQEEKANADRRQAEMKYLGEFIVYALEDSIVKRARFAEYFATLTISDDLRDKWKDYHSALTNVIETVQDTKKELVAEISGDGNEEKIKALERKLAILQQQIDPLLIDEFKIRLRKFIRMGSKDIILQLQKNLMTIGYPVRSIDGIVGPHLQAAIVNFAADHGLLEEPIPKLLSVLAEMSEQKRLDPNK